MRTLLNKNAYVQGTSDSHENDSRYVTVNVGPEHSAKEFRISKDILAAQSPVFRQELSSSRDGHNTIGTQLSIPDVTVRGFMHFIRWLSDARLYINNMEEAVESLQVAVKFRINLFTRLCRHYIRGNLTFSNVILVMDNCKDIYFDLETMNSCLAICERETSGVIQSPAFLEATSHAVESIVKCPRLILDSEVQLFEFVLRWGKSECARNNVEPSEINLRTVLKNILPCIKFLDMTMDQFAHVVLPSKILTREEQIFTGKMLTDNAALAKSAGFLNGVGSRIFKGYTRLIGSIVHTKTSSLPLPMPIMPEMEFYVSLTVVTGTIQVDKMVFCDINTSCSSAFFVKGKFQVSNTTKETSVTFEGDTKVEESKLTLKCPPSLTADAGDTVNITATIMEGPSILGVVYYRGQYTFLLEGVQINFRDRVEEPPFIGTISHQLSELHVFYKEKV